MNDYKIFTINPGSTSTKIAIYQGDIPVFNENILHSSEELGHYCKVSDQLLYRRKGILDVIKKCGVSLEDISAVVGRGGGLMPVEGGVYAINALLLEHAGQGANGIQHPAQLGAQLAHEFAGLFRCPAFVVNPPDTDELEPAARMTGVKGIYRNVHLHALNLKETAIVHAEKIGKRYEECNFIVCHLGGGISVSAHRKGRMIDGNDIVGGEGSMAPTRCGAVPAIEMIRFCFSGVTEEEAMALCTKTGGFMSHLGTSDALEVYRRAAEGEKVPGLVWEAMIYQIIKEIGSMAAVLHGQVEGILLGGQMAYNKDLVAKIKDACNFIAPVVSYPGEFEMKAMAAGAIRVLNGTEKEKQYTGKPVWDKTEFEE